MMNDRLKIPSLISCLEFRFSSPGVILRAILGAIPGALILGTLMLAALLFWVPAANAHESTNVNAAQASVPRMYENDNWFFYVSAGSGRSVYDSEIENRIALQKAQGGETPQTGYFDLPAIYRRLSPGLGVGVVMNWALEHVARDWRENNSFAVHSYNLAISSLWFTSGRMGDGWFLRGDLGHSRIMQLREVGDEFDRVNDDAVFTQAAIGYGIRAGPTTSLLLHVNASQTLGGRHFARGTNFNIGFLF